MSRVPDEDAGLVSIKASRQSGAVIKLQLAKLRSSIPELPILAFEGDDDKCVYSQWISRARSNLEYAMMPCGGKAGVLELRQSLSVDRTGLANGVFFFADRDFDDLRDQPPGADIFMTDTYSVENYLVSERVLESLLKVEFHCHADPELVQRTVEIFKADYGEFLSVTKEANLRLFAARQIGAEVERLPTSIGKIAKVEFGKVSPGSLSSDSIVRFAEASDGLIAGYEAQFSTLSPNSRYRGKFALLFFSAWLQCLAAERKKASPHHFSALSNTSKFRTGELTLANFASKSALPLGFHAFLESIPDKIAA